MRITAMLATSMLFALAVPANAQNESGKPAFRVPIGETSSSTAAPPTYAWMENVGTCSNACGQGTRTTSYQCQNASAFDFTGGGYGAPEADKFCTATSPKPAASSTACTNYSGCSYDWVKPAVTVKRLVKPNPAGGSFPIGQVNDCSYGKRVFAPYCQRTTGGRVTMAQGDHAFCRNDVPDYDDVAAGRTDSLGYDRTEDDTTGCIPGSRDYGWKTGSWSPPSSTCSAAPTHTRSVECVLKFNGQDATDDKCVGMDKPVTTETIAAGDFTDCGFEWDIGSWGAYSSTCSNTATRTRTVTCERSDGATVSDQSCAPKGTKPATSETGPNLVGCSYAWNTPTAWTYASNCSASTTRTRTVQCIRSDGPVAADSKCTTAKPVTSESGISNLTNCTYAPRDMGRTACANSQLLQYWDCTRSDGTTGFPASMCGKTNPETQSCTMPPPVYTYVPVNRGETACAGSQKQVYWDCTRNDGTTGFPASMCGKTSPETQSCVMPSTYAWAATAWSGYSSTCSANASQTRTVYCRRDQDGAQVADASCTGSKPNNVQYSSNYSGCGYSAAYGSWSGCSNSTQTRPVSCTRSDGVNVDPSLCGISASGGQQSQSCVSDPYPTVFGKTCGPNPLVAACQARGYPNAASCVGGTVVSKGSWNGYGLDNGVNGPDPMSTPGYCETTSGNNEWTSGNYEYRSGASLQCLSSVTVYNAGAIVRDCDPRYYQDTLTIPVLSRIKVPGDVQCTGSVVGHDVYGYLIPRATRCLVLDADYVTRTMYSGPANKSHPGVEMVQYQLQ